jgi:hypothetical protein
VSGVEGKPDYLIIGNAPTVLNRKLGKEIDSYKYVVRINDYVTQGYEECVGTKTSIWVTGASKNTKIKNRDLENIISLVFLPEFIHNAGKNYLKKRVETNLGLQLSSLNIVPYKIINQINILCNMEGGAKERPSAGLMTIMYFVHILNELVTITGFDFFESNKHYYDNEPAVPKKSVHNTEHEKQIVQRLIEDGKVFEL